MPPPTLRTFQPADRDAFLALNLSWIEQHFAIEESDRNQLEHPEETILQQGGEIIVAELNGQVVATGAIIPPQHPPADDRRWLEIVKMATDQRHQGQGIGHAILQRLITAAKTRGAQALWLETNAKLAAATHLYKKAGFRPLTPDEWWPSDYSRCNLQMILEL